MRTHQQTHNDDRLDEIIAECLSREDSGEPIDVERIKAQHPDLAEPLDAYFRDLKFLEGFLNRVRSDSAKSAGGSAGSKQIADQPRTIIGSRYQLIRRLGRGGMGTVHLAYDPQLDRNVALKFGNFFAEESQERLQRFQTEARALASLHHPNICQVHDFGEHDGQPFIVMQHIGGLPLSHYIDSQTIQPIRDTVRLIHKLSLALAELHAKKILHRDIKPTNIMVDDRAEPVIVDFGLARREQDPRLSTTGVPMGTPQYMSPQQVEGRNSDASPVDDIHALGVVFYQLLTGCLPYTGRGFKQLMLEISAGRPAPPSEHCADIDSRLDVICLRMMAGPIEQRYRSMTEVASALAAWLAESSALESRSANAPRPNPPSSLPVTIRRQSDFAPISESAQSSEPKGSLSTAEHSLVTTRFSEDEAPQPVGKLQSSLRRLRIDELYSPPRQGLKLALLAVLSAVILAAIIIRIRIPDDPQSPIEVTIDTEPKRAPAAAAVPEEAAPTQVAPVKPLVFTEEFQKVAIVPAGIADPIGIAFDYSSTRVAVAQASGVRIYNAVNKKLEKELLKSDDSPVLKLASSADGTRLAAATRKTVHVWDFVGLEERQVFSLQESPATKEDEATNREHPNIALSGDGRFLAATRRSLPADQSKEPPAWSIDVWDIESKKVVRTLTFEHEPLSVALTPDGGILAAGGLNGDILSWSIPKGELLYRNATKKNVLDLNFSPSGKLLAVATLGQSPVLQDALTGARVRELSVVAVQNVAFSPQGTALATISEDRGVRYWDVESGKQRGNVLHIPERATALTFSPDGLYLAVACPKGIDAWMLPATAQADFGSCLIGMLFHPDAALSAMVPSPSGETIAAAGTPVEPASHAEIWIWDIGQRILSRKIGSNLSTINRLRFSPSGSELAAMSETAQFEFYDPGTGDQLLKGDVPASSTIKLGPGRVFDFEYVEFGRQLLVAGRAGYDAFDADSLKRIRQWKDPFPGDPHVLHAVPSLELMLAGAVLDRKNLTRDGEKQASVRVWSSQQDNPVQEWKTESFQVDVIDASSDGSLVLTGGLGVFELWDRRQPAPIRLQPWERDPRGGPFRQTCGALSPDGRQVLLATTNQGRDLLAIYDARSGGLCAELPAHRGGTTAARFLPDGIHAVTIGHDQTVRIWRIAPAADRDRPAAEWVVKHGGQVRFVDENGRTVGYTTEIPTGAVTLVGVTLNDKPGLPRTELNRLALLPRLRELQFINSAITDDGVVGMTGLPQLSMLYFNGTQISDQGLRVLPQFTNLTRLGLQRTRITSRGVEHLVPLQNLASLDLSSTSVDDAAIPYLNALPNLSELFLGDTAVTDVLANELRRLPRLRLLNLSQSQITEAAAERLKSRLPTTKVIWSPRVAP